MKTIAIIVGTRPELIKLYPLIRALGQEPTRFQVKVVFTGQHQALLDEIAAELGVQPQLRLDVMSPGQSLAQLQLKLIEALSEVIAEESPQLIIGQGDTMSAYAAAMTAFLHRTPFAHVEAGLRSGSCRDPYPEEGLRRAISPLTTLHLAPTAQAKQNLLNEGIRAADIAVTGNTAIDTLVQIGQQLGDEHLPEGVNAKRRLVLVTLHRRENHGEPMARICRAIRVLSKIHPELEWLFPVHPNPNVQALVHEALGHVEQVKLVKPLGYKSFVASMKHASLILTDSGGVQEEAPSFNAPILVARETTERPEGVEAGFSKLVGSQIERIVRASLEALDGQWKRPDVANPYGDGQASARIVEQLIARGFGEPAPTFHASPTGGQRLCM